MPGELQERRTGLVREELNQKDRNLDPHSLGNRAAFESELFKDGVYTFDSDTELRASGARYQRDKEWIEKFQGSPVAARELLDFTVNDESYKLIWKQVFSGKIPRHWASWFNVEHDLKRARARHVQLSSDLVGAAVSNPHWAVVQLAALSQRLSARQLGSVLAQDNAQGELDYGKILAAQIDKGMPLQEIRKALRLAFNFKKKKERQGKLPPVGQQEHRFPRSTETAELSPGTAEKPSN